MTVQQPNSVVPETIEMREPPPTVNMANESCSPAVDDIPLRSRREESADRQRPRRLAEWSSRERAVTITQWASSIGFSGSWVARRLGLRPRTLNHWLSQSRSGELQVRLRGRPPEEPTLATAHTVLRTIDREGGSVGLPTLRSVLPGVSRSVVLDLREDYRRWHRGRFQTVTHELTWHQPGAVWAIDHAEPSLPVDGICRAILAVRDLASGYQLAWLPVPDQTAKAATFALAGIIHYYGAPLVLKSDNGSAFISGQFAELLEQHDIVHLRNPPRRPQYNGSCEAAIGAMKVRTEHFAERNRRSAAWNSTDLHAALVQANEVHRTEADPYRSAKQRWEQRPTISADDRNQLRSLISGKDMAIWNETEQAASRPARSDLMRTAIAWALQSLGILTLKRRLIHLPFIPFRLARFP